MSNHTRRNFLRQLGLGAAALAAPRALVAAAKSAAPGKPNIIFVMADDMGYGDVGCYNPRSKIPTPHLDRLAREGVRFTDAHSPSAVCTPTRYGVLTGRYCWRTWLQRNVVGGYTPPLIEPERPTVGSFLKRQGYTTACIGKWHLGLGWERRNGFVGKYADGPKNNRWQDGDPEKGEDVDFTKPVQGGPSDLGFDFAFYTAACSTIDGPFCYIRDRQTVGIPNQPIPVDQSKDADLRPRKGWMTPGFDIENVDPDFTKEAIKFIERGRARKPAAPFFLYLALSAPHAPWLPPDFVKGRSQAGPRGDQVALVDWCVGQLVAALDRLNLKDDTLLIVTGDNGPRHGVNGHQAAGEWRGHKSHIWEGGHREPFIVRWPGHAKAGSTCDEPVCLTDLMATCAAVVGAALPAEAGPDSFNILPAILGEKLERPIHEALVSHSCFGVFAIRQGPWKLILDTQGSGGWVEPSGENPKPGTPGQLYHMQQDPGEKNNLFGRHPEIVTRLTALLEKYKTTGRSAPRAREAERV